LARERAFLELRVAAPEAARLIVLAGERERAWRGHLRGGRSDGRRRCLRKRSCLRLLLLGELLLLLLRELRLLLREALLLLLGELLLLLLWELLLLLLRELLLRELRLLPLRRRRLRRRVLVATRKRQKANRRYTQS
jgi:hypothetical protein